MPKIRRSPSYHRRVLKDDKQLEQLCREYSWDDVNDFRATVMAMSQWTLPAETFFRADGTFRTIKEVCTIIPKNLLVVPRDIWNVRSYLRGRRGSDYYNAVTENDFAEAYKEYINDEIDSKYDEWESDIERVMRHSDMAKDERDALRIGPATIRKSIMQRYRGINALSMIDPFGAPLNPRGIIRATYVYRPKHH